MNDYVVIIRMINGATHSMPVKAASSEEVAKGYLGDSTYIEVVTPSVSALLTREHMVDVMVMPKEQHDRLLLEQRAAAARQGQHNGIVV